MCIFNEKKKRVVRRSTIEIIDYSTVHNNSKMSRVSINSIAPIIHSDESKLNNRSSNDSGNSNSGNINSVGNSENSNSENNSNNANNSSSDISDIIDKDNMISLNELTKRSSFDINYKIKQKTGIKEAQLVEKIIKKTMKHQAKRISVDKYEHYIPIIYKIILNKPELSILELNYENQNNKLPWCHNIKNETDFY
jgi:predicted P-loop ATPase